MLHFIDKIAVLTLIAISSQFLLRKEKKNCTTHIKLVLCSDFFYSLLEMFRKIVSITSIMLYALYWCLRGEILTKSLNILFKYILLFWETTLFIIVRRF